jgi:hypothetical protein
MPQVIEARRRRRRGAAVAVVLLVVLGVVGAPSGAGASTQAPDGAGGQGSGSPSTSTTMTTAAPPAPDQVGPPATSIPPVEEAEPSPTTTTEPPLPLGTVGPPDTVDPTSAQPLVPSGGLEATADPAATPTPPDLWDPPDPVGPGRSFVVLEGTPGEYVSFGGRYTYTKADAILDVTLEGQQLSVRVDGDEWWYGSFEPAPGTPLGPGFHPDARRIASTDPPSAVAGWWGEGRSCNTSRGWLAVDELTVESGQLVSLSMRFEQRCEGGPAALRGEIRWVASDPTSPAGPVNPPPAGLWDVAPPVGAGQSYVVIDGQPGDRVSMGLDAVYTKANAELALWESSGSAIVRVDGDQDWNGTITPPAGRQIEVGYLGSIGASPFHNPVRGGMSWTSEGRGCGSVTGWFVVDEVVRTAGALTTLTIRFEQRCDGGAPLYGEVRWVASDTTTPPGPVVPVPGDLWDVRPEVPANQSYVSIDGAAGDHVSATNGGAGRSSPWRAPPRRSGTTRTRSATRSTTRRAGV